MSEQFLSVKIPEALAKRVGATGADFSAKLAEYLDGEAAKLSAAESAKGEASAADASLVARLEAVEAKLAAKPAEANRVELLDEARKVAKEEASASLSAILAKGGGAPLATANVPANEGSERTYETALAELTASGKSKGEAIRVITQKEPALYQAWLAKLK